ncbi:ABC transporter ATP-binding protein [Nocardioides alcanivorans]|uniref:ABC transporter ATP-binding protein n=1 Tax=Nocardioides alcanivorans TaxID=2897352 RepID=UPI001F40432E|nr:ABC transporter ATP-binding protein [Nocardioides alcanivorans]
MTTVSPGDIGHPVLRMSDVTKSFNGVAACDGVDFSVAAGEVHGLLGQNGAGKSTLMNILMGLVRADRGTIEIAGRPRSIRGPQDARLLGVGMVHQHYSLIPTLSVWENVALNGVGKIERDVLVSAISETSERFGLQVDPLRRVGELSVGEQQRVELVKCLIEKPRLLVLDEPTAVLTTSESRSLFSMLEELVGDGACSVILISHDLGEIRRAAQRATVMRGGQVVAQVEPATVSAAELARHMIGRDLPRPDAAAAIGLEVGTGAAEPGQEPVAARSDEPVLRIAGAAAGTKDGKRRLDGLDLEVHAGEILGVAGVEGNGQAWLAELLLGGLSLDSGTVHVAGRRIPVGRPGCTRAARVAVVPEDRRVSGCVLDMSVAENLGLASLEAMSRFRLVSRTRLRALAQRLTEEFDVSMASMDQPMRSLSGGNQQKVVLAREMSTDPEVLVLAQPTRGLDVGAVAFLHERVRAAARDGVAVLLISTDLNEILQLSDRIAVMYRGRVQGELSRSEADAEKLGLLMGGMSA